MNTLCRRDHSLRSSLTQKLPLCFFSLVTLYSSMGPSGAFRPLQDDSGGRPNVLRRSLCPAFFARDSFGS